MASSFSTNLLLIEMTPGDPAVFNAWGTNLNNGMIALIDSAVAGVLTVDVTTLTGYPNAVPTSTAGAADQARNAHFKLTGVLTSNTLVLFPSGLNRNFTLNNATTGAFSLTVGVNNGSGGAAGTTVAVPRSQSVFLLSDGTNVTSRFNSFVGGLTVDTLTISGAFTLGTPLGAASGGTGRATLTAHSVIVGNGTGVVAQIGPDATVGHVLASNGAGADPSFQIAPVVGGGTGQSAYTDGQLLIGNTSTGGLTKTTLTAGSNITITNAGGSITIAATAASATAFRKTSAVAGTNTITATASPAPVSYVAGDTYEITLANTITGAATVNLNGLGPQNLLVNVAAGPTACRGGEGVAGGTYLIVHDGTQFILQDPTPSEGSWTPTVAGSVTAGTQTYAFNVGRWVRDGNLVTFWAKIAMTALDGATAGNVTIAGFPFTTSTVANLQYVVNLDGYGFLTFSGGATAPLAFIQSNGSTIFIDQVGSGLGISALPVSGLSASTELILQGVIRIG